VDDCGFDPELDVELDDAVPTLALELKLTQSLLPTHTMDNPRAVFKNIHYADKDSTLVVMIYTPSELTEATDEAVARSHFWWEIAKGFKPGLGVKHYSWNATKAGERLPLRLLGETLCNEFERQKRFAPLPAYGTRSRDFDSQTHARGQRGIDAFEDQVLRPLGARLVPTADGCEGGAGDRDIQWNDGTRRVAQFKVVCLGNGHAGFYARMNRIDGSIPKEGGGSSLLRRPYSVQDKVDVFVYLCLADDNNLAEYWCATVQDLLGDGPLQRLITDADGVGGVTGFFVHPLPKDKERLGDTNPNKPSQNAMAVRTRQWVRSLGPIVDPGAAAALKQQAIADRRTLRLSAKAERAALAAAEAAARPPPAAAPQVVNNNNNITFNIHYHSEEATKRRRVGDIRGFFSK
jgi:hypothetical protein